MNRLVIRNETEADYRVVEELTRDAFWNVHVPGCDEHYLVHIMRNHKHFINELDFVAQLEDKVVGNIMYTKSHLINECNTIIDSATFGPVSVLPDYQRQGIGSALIKYSINRAFEMGYKVIVIQGHPYNYCKHGFVGSQSVNVADSDGSYPYSLLVLELEKGVLIGDNWRFYQSNVYEFDGESALLFDKSFPPKERSFRPSQEEFRIASRAFII